MSNLSSDDRGSPLNANGAAYTSSEGRHGVPLEYIAEKLMNAIEELHSLGRSAIAKEALVPAMYYSLVAYLALNNMLGKADDRSLATRLLNGSSEELRMWLDLVLREGDVRGLAGLIDEGNTGTR